MTRQRRENSPIFNPFLFITRYLPANIKHALRYESRGKWKKTSSDPQTLAEPPAILACSMFVPAFRHYFAAPKVSPDHPSGERNSRLCISASLGFISRPKVCAWFISIAKGCILRLSPPDAFIVQVMFCKLLYDICLLCGMDVLKTCNRLAWSL